MATDASGNSNDCTFSVTVVDNEAPVFSGVTSITISVLPPAVGAIVTFNMPTVTDNCPGSSVIQISGPVSGDFLNIGQYTATFNFTDFG